MKELNFVEKYILCLLDNKHQSTLYSSYKYKSCILNACLWQLYLKNLIIFDSNKRLIINKEFSWNNTYIKTIYDSIYESKARILQKLEDDYLHSFSKYSLYFIIDNIISLLIYNNYLTIETKTGIFNEKVFYKPNKDYINIIIQEIKSEILDSDKMSDDIFILYILLNESNILKKYFSIDDIKK